MSRLGRPAAGDRVEWLLLALAACFVAAGMASLSLALPDRPGAWIGLAVWLAGAGLGALLLRRYLPRRDPLLYPVAMLLSGWGLVAIERLAPAFAARQSAWLLIALAGMLAVALKPQALRWLRRYRYVLLALALTLLLATIALGSNPSGFDLAPRLWLSVGTVFFQPSELMKIVLLAFLASYLGEGSAALRLQEARPAPFLSPRLLGPTLLMWLLSLLILLWQRDLGAAMLFFLVFLLLLYVAYGDWRVLLGGSLLALLAGGVAYAIFDVVRLRVDIWLNPWLEAEGRAYQVVQSLMAVASGGIFGAGPGLGSPGYVPVAHSDFIFAALAEEWGLLGVIAVLGCFGAIAWRGFAIASQWSGRAFHALFAAGLTIMLVGQALMIMAGVLKLAPLTGVTLPFVSYGGSSLLVCFLMIGLLLRLSAEAP